MESKIISSLEDMGVFAKEVLKSIEPHESSATVLSLKGDLGAGKTAFVKALAAELGVEEHVTSPTFVIMKTYNLPTYAEAPAGAQPTTNNKFEKLVHVDAYRLESAHELMMLNWKNITSDPTTIIALEWPERVPEAVPKDAVQIEFEYVNENVRRVTENREH